MFPWLVDIPSFLPPYLKSIFHVLKRAHFGRRKSPLSVLVINLGTPPSSASGFNPYGFKDTLRKEFYSGTPSCGHWAWLAGLQVLITLWIFMDLVCLHQWYPSLLHQVTMLENSGLASLKIEFLPIFFFFFYKITKKTRLHNSKKGGSMKFCYCSIWLAFCLISIRVSLVIFLPLGISANVYFNGQLYLDFQADSFLFN